METQEYNWTPWIEWFWNSPFSNVCNIWYNFSLTLSSRGTAFKCHSLNVLNSTATFKSSWIPFIVPKQIQSSFHNEGKRMITTIQCQQGFLISSTSWQLKMVKEPNVGTNPARIYFQNSKTTKLQSICVLVQTFIWTRPVFYFQGYWKKRRKKKMYSQQRAELKKKKQLCGPQFPVIKSNEYFTGTLNWIMAYH